MRLRATLSKSPLDRSIQTQVAIAERALREALQMCLEASNREISVQTHLKQVHSDLQRALGSTQHIRRVVSTFAEETSIVKLGLKQTSESVSQMEEVERALQEALQVCSEASNRESSAQTQLKRVRSDLQRALGSTQHIRRATFEEETPLVKPKRGLKQTPESVPQMEEVDWDSNS